METGRLLNNIIAKMKTYHPSKDFSIIEKAYETALLAHGDQFRRSGEPYIIHPLQVALILAELEMDKETIAAGILHDIIEDTDFTYERIAQEFSEEIAVLVDGVTKLGKIEFSSKEEAQADNFRKMFLAMADDIRVILIKLADRLHNMRTLQFMSQKKQEEKAQETIDIYAPIAQRLGIYIIGTELEDLSLKYLKPAVYVDLVEKVERKKEDRIAFLDGLVNAISRETSTSGIKKARVEGRQKHYYSIYRKMISQNKSLDQIYDLFAVRIVVGTVKDCYGVLGVIHEMFKPMPGRFKDYIAMPKANMYKSLHNTLIGPDGVPFEVQIRTMEMHRAAEYGIAAHWRYKSGDGGGMDKTEEEKLSWLRQILEWQKDLSDNKEFLNAVKLDLDVGANLVYAFTPRGDVKELPAGSTPIDFAYLIHSAVGNRMVGARVNGRIVTFDYAIKNGDIIDIITSNNSKGPSRDWLSNAKSQQARTKINQWFKKEFKEENIVRGKELLDKEAKRKGLALSELLRPKWMELIIEKYGFNDWDALCAAIGHGGIKEGAVLNRLNEELQKENEKNRTDESVIAEINKSAEIPRSQHSGGVIIKNSDFETSYRLSRCCNPVPGDEIVGFVTRGRGVSVHRTDCVNIINLGEDDRKRLLEVEWPPSNDKAGISYHAEIKITADDRIGLIVDVSKVFRDEEISVHQMTSRVTKTGEAIFDIIMEISSRKQLDKVTKRLKNMPDIYSIERVTT